MSQQAKARIRSPAIKQAEPSTRTRKFGSYPSVHSPVEQILYLQRTLGNQATQRLFESGMIQAMIRRKEVSEKISGTIPLKQLVQRKNGTDIKTLDWKAGVELAENAAKNPKTKDIAKGYYIEMVVRAAQKVSAPAPLVDKKPVPGDILWSWTTTREYAATTDPKKVDKAPDDYWKWLQFNPGAVQKDEAFTVSTILHELDHAAHAKALYNEWKKATTKKKETWADFYLAHYTKWTEKEIKIAKVGAVGALAGLPEKIRPSAIEFRAYANQFVNYFHKLSTDKQEYMALAVILFYPLRIQKVEAKISDPTLDVSAARQQILDYFNSPPVKDKTQQDIIKIRVATELKSALFLFRPAEDHAQIKMDFRDILDYPVDSEERKEARKNYRPEAL